MDSSARAASLSTQRHALTTLGQMQRTIVDAQLASPCIIVVGEVLQGVALAALADESILQESLRRAG